MSGFLFDQDEAVADQIDALDPLPQEWWRKWEARTNEFTEAGQPKEGREVWSLERRFNLTIQEPRIGEGTAPMDDDESRAFIGMIKGMLRFRPEERMTCEQVLRSEWMEKWALPAAGDAWAA